MIFGSVCSGIEAASVAWNPLGWRAAFMAEIDPFACAVLAHHYPDVPNLGDITKFKDWPDATIDVLAGGTPCQSFSTAGLRKGLADPRGNLCLTYLAIAARYRPRWLVWENVPGVLSSEGGGDFSTFLGALGHIGYGWAYRVLDAQYFGVPQRRRRVFVVASARGWASAAAVLFDQSGMRGDSPPRREAGEGFARPLGSSSARGSGYRNDVDTVENLMPVVAAPLTRGAEGGSRTGYAGRRREDDINLVPATARTHTRGGQQRLDPESETLIPTIGGGFDVSHSLRASGFDASEDGTGRGTPLVPVYAIQDGARRENLAAGPRGSGVQADIAFTLEARASMSKIQMVTAFAENSRAELRFEGGDGQRTGALSTGGGKAGQAIPTIAVIQSRMSRDSQQNGAGIGNDVAFTLEAQDVQSVGSRSGVRRLTPMECERLQGFPDGYTAIKYRGKPAADGPRYRALGNSWAVPCPRWIGERIELVGSVMQDLVL